MILLSTLNHHHIITREHAIPSYKRFVFFTLSVFIQTTFAVHGSEAGRTIDLNQPAGHLPDLNLPASPEDQSSPNHVPLHQNRDYIAWNKEYEEYRRNLYSKSGLEDARRTMKGRKLHKFEKEYDRHHGLQGEARVSRSKPLDEVHSSSSSATQQSRHYSNLNSNVRKSAQTVQEKNELRRKTERERSAKRRRLFSPEKYEEAKSTMTTQQFEKYKTEHDRFWLSRKNGEEKGNAKKKRSTQRIKNGTATAEDIRWKEREKLKNQKAYIKRKQLGVHTPSYMKRKQESLKKKTEKRLGRPK